MTPMDNRRPFDSDKLALLTPAEMDRADHLAVASGISPIELMEHAGAAVAVGIGARWTMRPLTVLWGPGNNGGDDFVTARHLAAAGCLVKLVMLGEREKPTGEGSRCWPVEGSHRTILQGIH